MAVQAVQIALICLLISFHSGSSFILIPEEFTTIGNAIWSYLPPIKSGVSSKVGFGFRIGRNADFQVLFEIGPQMNNTRGTPKLDTEQNEITSRRKRTKSYYKWFGNNG